MPAVPSGQIILLKGVSSSGKTSIAEQLLLVLDSPDFHMSVNGMRARKRTAELSPVGLTAVLTRTRAGFHRAVARRAKVSQFGSAWPCCKQSGRALRRSLILLTGSRASGSGPRLQAVPVEAPGRGEVLEGSMDASGVL